MSFVVSLIDYDYTKKCNNILFTIMITLCLGKNILKMLYSACLLSWKAAIWTVRNFASSDMVTLRYIKTSIDYYDFYSSHQPHLSMLCSLWHIQYMQLWYLIMVHGYLMLFHGPCWFWHAPLFCNVVVAAWFYAS